VRPAIAGLTSSGGPGIQVQQLKSLTIDTAAPPAFSSGPSSRIDVHLPAAPGAWSIAATVDVGTTIQQTIAGIPLQIPISVEVTVRVDGIQIDAPLDFDMSVPQRPRVAGAGTPQVAMQLSISSTDPLVGPLAGAISQALDPVIRLALSQAPQLVASQLGTSLQGLNDPPWGNPGPGVAPVAAPVDLEQVALGISTEIQRVHFPFGTTMLPVKFDQPGYGNGSPIDYTDYGDSDIWTGSYLMSEAMRWDLTGDPRALAGATRALDGLEADLDVGGPSNGLLARCAIPLSSPFISVINGGSDYYTGVHDGVALGGFSEISRDQNIGAMLGCAQAFLRVPQLRAVAGRCMTRIVTYLVANDWIAYHHNSGVLSAEFTPAADVMWAFMSCAALADAATWGPYHDANRDLARIMWFPVWISSRDLNEFYKYNLMHETIALLVSTEADPVLYREDLKVIEIGHDTVSTHGNPWFDAVYGMAVPTAAPAMGPLVERELQRWTLRDRRCAPTNLLADPTIPKVLIPATASSAAQWMATEPVPIEKRPHGDFLWQQSPFQIDGGISDPQLQEPGVDLVLPYWTARAYGMIR
jgi:hypothetical protein